MKHKVGITGNYYFTSPTKEELELICDQLYKAKSSIYWNEKYQVFAIRIKSLQHKRKVKQLQRSGG